MTTLSMVFPETSDGTLKLTKPRVTRFEFLPALISSPVFPPPLLDSKPSTAEFDPTVMDFEVAAGVGVGLFVALGVGVTFPDPLVSGDAVPAVPELACGVACKLESGEK